MGDRRERERLARESVVGAMKQVVVIGSGFAGLAAACRLARDGYAVTVLEKNDQLGGRARTWVRDGFTFDMGTLTAVWTARDPLPDPGDTTTKYWRDAASTGEDVTGTVRIPAKPGSTAREPSTAIEGPGMPFTEE